MMKTIKVTNGTYVELLRLKANLMMQDGEIRTFDDAITELLEAYEELSKVFDKYPDLDDIKFLAGKFKKKLKTPL